MSLVDEILKAQMLAGEDTVVKNLDKVLKEKCSHAYGVYRAYGETYLAELDDLDDALILIDFDFCPKCGSKLEKEKE